MQCFDVTLYNYERYKPDQVKVKGLKIVSLFIFLFLKYVEGADDEMVYTLVQWEHLV